MCIRDRFKEDSGSRDVADAALDAYNQAVALASLDAAQVAQKAAVLKAAKINLNYTNIVSPVDGTVVTRDITAGQTVAASLQTPTLFLIATDLTKMQVDTSVSESDIAGAVEGAGASFTVDAFPSKNFQGSVVQVRQSPISVQNEMCIRDRSVWATKAQAMPMTRGKPCNGPSASLGSFR